MALGNVMARLVGLVPVLLLVVSLSGCLGREQPLYTAEQHHMPAMAQSLSLDQIRDVISRAAIDRGWVVERQANNTVRVKLSTRGHVAVADVSYSKEAFSITYVDSENLLYDGRMIHRNYNRWVMQLEKDIEAALQKAAL
jgi:hypothetical protein